MEGRFKREGISQSVSSVTLSCLTLCNPMDCSMPGLPVHHELPSLCKLMSIEVVMPSNHLILCRPPLLPSVFPSIRLFSNESVLHIKRPRYWSFSFIISPSSEYPGLICMNGIMQYKVFYASFTQRNVFEGHHIKMCLSIFFLFIPAGVP